MSVPLALLAQLVVEIPGNPWQGRINARDRAGVTRSGKPYNRKQKGFADYQDRVALWVARAVAAQAHRFPVERVELWVTLWVPDRRRRDLDGPIKALMDGVTQGGGWGDDSQVDALHVRRARGAGRAQLIVRKLTDPGAVC